MRVRYHLYPPPPRCDGGTGANNSTEGGGGGGDYTCNQTTTTNYSICSHCRSHYTVVPQNDDLCSYQRCRRFSIAACSYRLRSCFRSPTVPVGAAGAAALMSVDLVMPLKSPRTRPSLTHPARYQSHALQVWETS